jgi:hypothetical protein
MAGSIAGSVALASDGRRSAQMKGGGGSEVAATAESTNPLL